MKKILTIAVLMLLVLPVIISAKVNYLSEEEYKDLNKAEREAYWQDLQSQQTDFLNRKSQAIDRQAKARQRIEELRSEIEKVENENKEVYSGILEYLDVDKNDVSQMRSVEKKINYFNDQLNNFNSLSDVELWQQKKDVDALAQEWNRYKQNSYTKMPDFQDQVVMIENRLTQLDKEIENNRPKYFEDEYSVVEGDYLSKIAGYSFIYNDTSKWGIIYRANRDQIKDPNILSPNQKLKIPRGKPNTWKVYKGESLWRISSYPEVYGTGTKWPSLYRANEDQIKDPDLIYPNQILEIPRD